MTGPSGESSATREGWASGGFDASGRRLKDHYVRAGKTLCGRVDTGLTRVHQKPDLACWRCQDARWREANHG